MEKAKISFPLGSCGKPRVCQCCVGAGGTARAATGNTDSFWFLFQRPWHPFAGTKIMEGQVGWPVKAVGPGVRN